MGWTWTWYFLLSISSFLSFHLFLRINRNRTVWLRWPVVGMLPGLLANLHRLHDDLTAILRETGCTAEFKGPWLMGLDFLLTCDPANAKHLYNANFPNYPKGREFFDIFHDIFGHGILASDGHLWSQQRKMANTHMSSHNFRASVAERSRDKVENQVLPLLATTAGLGRAFDLQDFLKRFTLDVVSSMIAGSDPGCLTDDSPSVPFVVAVSHMEEVLLYRHVVPGMWWKLLRWLKMGEEKKMIMAREGIDRFVARCIEERRREEEKKGRVAMAEESNDLLTSYMYSSSLDDREKDEYLSTDSFLRDTLATFLAAGTNTQATALSWFFWQLSKCPDVEKRVLEELREAQSKLRGVEENNENRMVVFDVGVTQGLVYLHAALCETLRLFPSVPFNHKMAVEEDVLPSGHRVRAGAMVVYSVYSAARMERFWGADCSEFKPDRWIDASSGQLKNVQSQDFLAFHYGPRACIGKNMAMTQMKILAASMVYNFHVEVVKGCIVEPRIAMILQMKNGLQVKVRKRGVAY